MICSDLINSYSKVEKRKTEMKTDEHDQLIKFYAKRVADSQWAKVSSKSDNCGNNYFDTVIVSLTDIPSDFFKLTSASKLLNNMMTNGTFTHIYHPHKENLFENASIDVIVFRYCKNNNLEKQVLYNDNLLYIINNDGLITFDKNKNSSTTPFKEYFDVYVGLVSGKENVYKNEHGNIEVLNGENKIDKYIYIERFPTDNEYINNYLLTHKEELITRKIKKFNDENWFEWGAPRNIKSIKENDLVSYFRQF